jgi:hypothetical protein
MKSTDPIHAGPAHPLDKSDSWAFVWRLMHGPALPVNPVASVEHMSAGQWQMLLSSPANGSLIPVLYYGVVSRHLPACSGAFSLFERGYAARVKKFGRLQEQAGAIASLLSGKNIRHRFFKGLDVARRLYPWPELRSFRDIDVVVMPDQVETAREILERAGWETISRMSYHDVLAKDGITVDLHRSLLNHAESVLHNFDAADTIRFIDGRMGIEEEFLVLALKLFSETVFDSFKILDLYLFRQCYGLDAEKLASVVRNHGARLPLQVLGSIINSYQTGDPMRAPGSVALRYPGVWAAVKNPCLLASVDHPLIKLFSLVFPNAQGRLLLYPGRRVSLLSHIAHSLSIFLGFRFVNSRLLRGTYGNI